ncbi:CopM family metallochaperone [Rhizobium binxianense]
MSLKILAISAILAIAPLPVLAQNMPMGQDMPMKMDHSMGGHSSMGDSSASSTAFSEANAKMHKDMAIQYSGDADADFVRSMIPHHQGAIDMAKIELQYGKDPELRKLAENIVKAQEAEIADMKAWLQAHGK